MTTNNMRELLVAMACGDEVHAWPSGLAMRERIGKS